MHIGIERCSVPSFSASSLPFHPESRVATLPSSGENKFSFFRGCPCWTPTPTAGYFSPFLFPYVHEELNMHISFFLLCGKLAWVISSASTYVWKVLNVFVCCPCGLCSGGMCSGNRGVQGPGQEHRKVRITIRVEGA